MDSIAITEKSFDSFTQLLQETKEQLATAPKPKKLRRIRMKEALVIPPPHQQNVKVLTIPEEDGVLNLSLSGPCSPAEMPSPLPLLASLVLSSPARTLTPAPVKVEREYHCKKCGAFKTTDKNLLSDHQREFHIDPDKVLECPFREEGCRFVTAYKQHLEYHVRNHAGSKPFNCPEPGCGYTCINKSMLTSHMRAHSSISEHQCSCGYSTKYRHSFKLHLSGRSGEEHSPLTPFKGSLSLSLSMVAATPKQSRMKLPKLKMPRIPRSIKAELAPQRERRAYRKKQKTVEDGVGGEYDQLFAGYMCEETTPTYEAIEGTPSPSSLGSDATGRDGTPTRRRRGRKGPAFRLDVLQRLQGPAIVEDEEWEFVQALSPQEAVQRSFLVHEEEGRKSAVKTSQPTVAAEVNSTRSDSFYCRHCRIAFEDEVLYALHCGFHRSKEEPFTCACGHVAADKVQFFMHIAQAAHAVPV
ncbi:putative Protein hunchback [Hypsibius exemplaris]|uniref:C2H2-type domain-containing protein n=1 Tax=Hypsibius exemplaris TaxID=2072580 RepID=A0A1W0XBA4_HYPEX|nr:putative Protein hunchback [Hypsibius exemplaris]